MADYSHTLIIRGEITNYAAEELVFQKVSGEICILNVDRMDNTTVVKIEPNILTPQDLEGRLNTWMNSQLQYDHQLVWWNRNPEWFEDWVLNG
jgi:hypothetical protein